MAVVWGGQYNDVTTLASSIGVSNDITTRIGIVTYSAYEQDHFRMLVEYNHRGLNGNRGFEDRVPSGNIVLTFSRLFAPRTEYFGASSSTLAYNDPEMRQLIQSNDSTGQRSKLSCADSDLFQMYLVTPLTLRRVSGI